MNKVYIAGLKINALTKEEFLHQALLRILNKNKTFCITPYSEFLYATFQNPSLLLNIFNSADFSLADGMGIFWAKRYLEIPLTLKSFLGKILQAAWQIIYSLASIIFYPSWIKSALPEKIVGADLVWDLSKLAKENGFKIFLLGGFGTTPQLAAEKLTSYTSKINNRHNSNHKFNIYYSSKNPDDASVIEDINLIEPDILLVAYGPIRQEEWIYENLPKLKVNLAIGVGGSLDYIAGVKSAPPKFIRYSGLEWLWRLITQPYRLKRIFNATFGLIWGLWHYKILSSFPLRANAVAVILNKNNEVLICQRNPKDFFVDVISSQATLKSKNYWQLPQGGINNKEDLAKAAEREALEETGLKNLHLIYISKKTHTYFWNNSQRSFLKNKNYRFSGQEQHVVYFKFLGNDTEIKVDQKEFIAYKWVAFTELQKFIHPERSNLTQIVMEDLNNLAENASI